MIEYQLYRSTPEGFIFSFLKEDVEGGFYRYTALRINRRKKLTKRIVDSIYKIHADIEGELDFIWFIKYFHIDLKLIDYLKYHCYPELEGAEFNIINNYVIS